MIRVDHGTEFTSQALGERAYRCGVTLDLVLLRQARRLERRLIERLNNRLRDECLIVIETQPLAGEAGLSKPDLFPKGMR